MPRVPTTSKDLIDLIRKSGIAPPEKLARLSELSLPEQPQKAAADLVTKGFVTSFQATQLLAGRHKGFRIGSYTILDLLGRGGMGAVYLAEHLALHRKVAIKVLVPGKDDDQKLALERFQREARSVAALDHPNIVRIFDVATHNKVPYLVMEYVEGETLQAVLDRDGPISFAIATEYVAQAASGLQHAFEKGFVHRDIKPGNLIRDKSDTIKILDMGLARSANASDKLTAQLDNGAVVGTADFIAPEQAINNPSVDIRSDIYSLGATLYSLIVGKPPFEGNTTQKLLQHQLRNAPSLDSVNTSLPKGLSQVVAKMLEKKPAERYQTPAEVIVALTPWMASSARIIVGLSRTSLAEDDNLQATLSGIHRSNSSSQLSSSSNRLPVITDGSDSSEIVPLAFGKETGALASAQTTREPNRPESPRGKTARSRRTIMVAVGAALLALGAIGAWLAFGGSQKPDSEQGGLSPDNNAKSGTIGEQASTTSAPSITTQNSKGGTPRGEEKEGSEKVIYKYDAAGQRPFTQRLTMVPDPKDATKTQVKILSQSGFGEPPAGWKALSWDANSEMDYFVELSDGKTALGIRNLRAPASAMLFSPSFECSTGLCRLKVEYEALMDEKKFVVRFKPADRRSAWDIASPQVTGEVWRVEDLIVDLKGATGGYFEFHNLDSDPNSSLRLRTVTITELKSTNHAAEKLVFKLDADELPEFRTTKQGGEKKSGDATPKVPGVSFSAYKPETVNEWVCGPKDGVKAIGFTNINDVRSAQIAVDLENESGLGLKFEPNQKLRLRVVYRTTGIGRGNMYFQTLGDWKGLGFVPLPNSNNEWKTAELVVVRGDKPIRCVIDANETGAENMLYIRSIIISDAGKLPLLPLDPSTWTDGPVVYSLDVSKIPAFRVQKEQFVRSDGEPETLPAGIGCHSWKEKSLGEFRCEKVDDVPALTLTNLNEAASAQFYFQLEGELKVALQPGKAYRVKVGYMTKNEAAGGLVVQTTPGYKAIVATGLQNSAGKWQTESVSFIRPPAEENVEVRMVIDNTSVGESNTLCIRSISVVELIAPVKK